MKNKIIILVVIFLSFYKNVNAETFYGEYRKVDDLGTYTNDSVKIVNYKLYNTYKTEYVDLGYLEKNEYYISDEKDYIENLVNVNVEEESDEYIKIKTNTEKTFMVYFYNIPNDLKIYEIELYIKDMNNCYGYMDSVKTGLNYINDNNYSTYIDNAIKENFGINLYHNYLVDEITLIIHTNEIGPNTLDIQVHNERINITLQNKNKHIITFKNEKDTNKEKVTYEYKALKKLYKSYKEEKIKLNNYVNSGNNILLDDYIELKEYYVRDKLILKDNLLIFNKDTKMNNFIEYSTDKVNINCNIDYKVNGIYNCEFILNDIIVSKEIIVNLPREEIKENQKINTDTKIQSIEETYSDKKQIIYQNNNIDKKELKNTYVKYSKTNNKKVIKEETIKHSKITTKKIKLLKNINSKDNVNNNKDKNIINLVKCFIFINLIVIEIILFIKKRKRDNVERV